MTAITHIVQLLTVKIMRMRVLYGVTCRRSRVIAHAQEPQNLQAETSTGQKMQLFVTVRFCGVDNDQLEIL